MRLTEMIDFRTWRFTLLLYEKKKIVTYGNLFLHGVVDQRWTGVAGQASNDKARPCLGRLGRLELGSECTTVRP